MRLQVKVVFNAVLLNLLLHLSYYSHSIDQFLISDFGFDQISVQT